MNEPKTTKQTWLSTISNMFQFILGFLLGVALVAGSAVAAAYFYFTKVSSSVPKKPIYTEEKSSNAKVVDERRATTQSENTTDNETQSSSENPNYSDNVAPANSEKPLESELATEESIPDGAYYASVTWPQGLSLRAGPDINAAKIGGIDYNSKILILEESSDKQWQKVQIPVSQQEGWVKAGNIERISN
jgi:hypothetical protein